MINQYINQPTSLSHISFIEFVANYDIRTFKSTKNQMLFVGLVLINTTILKTIIENCYYYFHLL